MDKQSQFVIFQRRKPKINAYRAIRGDGLEDAERFADDVLANFRIPARVTINAHRKQADKSGEFILVECKVAADSGMYNTFYMPFRIRKGRLMPPSVVSHENLGIRVLAQSTFDDIFKRSVSVPYNQPIPFNNSSGGNNFLQDLFRLFASTENDDEVIVGLHWKMKEDCFCSGTLLRKGDEVIVEGPDSTDWEKVIVFCSDKNIRGSVLRSKVKPR